MKGTKEGRGWWLTPPFPAVCQAPVIPTGCLLPTLSYFRFVAS